MENLVLCKEPCGCTMCNVHVYDVVDDDGGGDNFDDDDDEFDDDDHRHYNHID